MRISPDVSNRFTLDHEVMRDILLGKAQVEHCHACAGTGVHTYNGETGGILAAGIHYTWPNPDVDDIMLAQCSCDDCFGLGVIANLEGY